MFLQREKLSANGSSRSSKIGAICAHPLSDPTKEGITSKTQQGGVSDRKCLGQSQNQLTVTAPLAQSTKTHSNKCLGPSEQNINTDVTAESALPLEKEPTLTDVFMAVSACNGSLKDLCEQMKGVKEDLILVRQDLQKTAERTALEGKFSQLEDDISPIIVN